MTGAPDDPDADVTLSPPPDPRCARVGRWPVIAAVLLAAFLAVSSLVAMGQRDQAGDLARSAVEVCDRAPVEAREMGIDCAAARTIAQSTPEPPATTREGVTRE